MNNPEAHEPGSSIAELSYPRLWWLLMTAMAVALVFGLGMLEVIRLLARPLALLIFALTLAAALAPVVSWLERRMPRVLGIILTYLVVLVLLGALIWAVIPALVEQVQDLGGRIPDLSERARQLLNRWGGNLPGESFTNAVISQLSSQLSSLGPALLRLPLTVTSILSGILLILFISFYLLVEVSRIQKFILSLYPERQRARVNNLIVEMGQAMGGYFRGVVINGAIVGFVTFLGLLIIGVDFALVFGVLAGLLELIPIAGPVIATVIVVGLTLLQSPGLALAALIFMVVLQQVENNVLVPHIMRSQTEVSPLLSIMAIFAGGAIGGLLGALIAIPVVAALRVLVREVIAPAIRRQTGAEQPERKSE